jgi:hypothetical protein
MIKSTESRLGEIIFCKGEYYSRVIQEAQGSIKVLDVIVDCFGEDNNIINIYKNKLL